MATDRNAGRPRLATLLFDPSPETELRLALEGLATRLRHAVEVPIVAFVVADDADAIPSVMGISVAPDADPNGVLKEVLTADGQMLGLIGDAVDTGAPVGWPRLTDHATVLSRLSHLAAAGHNAAGAQRLLNGASGVAVPLGTPNTPHLGAVALISLDPRQPAGSALTDRIEEVTPQLSLTVRNHQWRDRNRRSRLIHEAVVEGSPNGIIVTDLRERVTTVNRSASAFLGVDLSKFLGQPIRDVIEQLRPQIVDPARYTARTIALHDGHETANDEIETVAGRILERYSAPVMDTSGEPLGRVEILSDVTSHREALTEAQRLATETARLRLLEERRAQEEMALARAAHMMASALTLSDIHEHLLDQAEELSGCDAAAVLVADAHGEIQPAATRGFSEAEAEQMAVPATDSLVARVLSGRHPFICNDADAERRTGRKIPGLDHVRSFVQVPLALGERIYGVLWATSSRPRAFGARELRLLTELGRHAEAAIQNALQFEQERHIAATLQYALLPDDLPVVPGLAMAALYRAAAGSRVGGDFYGAWELPDGRVGVVVGDVSGKGAEAAGVTAMVRYMVEGMSMREPEPGRLLGDLGDLIRGRLPEASLVTVLLVVIDADRAALSWASAGHVPALVLGVAGAVTALEERGPPCGAFPGVTYDTHHASFAGGETLVLYTDGILEARREHEMFGEERLAQILAAHAGDAPRDLARVIYSAARVFSSGHIDDDVAIAVVNRTT